jgi:hypothetical protein
MHEICLLAIAHAHTRRQFGAPSPAEIRRDEQAFYEQHAPATSRRAAARRLAGFAIVVLGAALAALAR